MRGTSRRNSLWTFPSKFKSEHLEGFGCWLPAYVREGFQSRILCNPGSRFDGTIHLVFLSAIARRGCVRPAWISLWQFEQTNMHFSNSLFVFSHDLVKPFVERPKSFLLVSRWWNSSAPWYLPYPHTKHFPPLYCMANAFNFFLRLSTASYGIFSTVRIFSLILHDIYYTMWTVVFTASCSTIELPRIIRHIINVLS